jgi:site-specific recombinase XerD
VDQRITANTRSWEQAERAAQAERDGRDPVKKKLQEIEDHEVQKADLRRTKNITVAVATDRWIAAQKIDSAETAAIYNTAARRINTWAADQDIEYLADITADMLDEWRGLWGKEAEKRYNQIGPTSQSHFQGYLKRFFRYCARTGFISINPSLDLRSIAKSKKRTEMLNKTQFRELLQVVPIFCAAQTGMLKEFTKELIALFLLQRWSGMRILDCLMLPRTALVGDNLQTTTKKTGAKVDCDLPEEAVSALLALSPRRERFKPEYFFWSVGIRWKTLSTKWGNFIRAMAPFLSFKDAKGEPMKFHSHMLRDTFAIEHLLAGASLEDVSKMLTHESIKVTEMYYGHWVPDRVILLKKKARESMKRQGATFAE